MRTSRPNADGDRKCSCCKRAIWFACDDAPDLCSVCGDVLFDTPTKGTRPWIT